MQVMWWGSYLKSIAPTCILRMRQSQSFIGARYLKRLEISESSVGSLAAYVDSWVRASAIEYGELGSWAEKMGREGVIIVDLFGPMMSGEDIRQIEVFEPIIRQSKAVVFLVPRVHYAGWMAALNLAESHPVRRAALLRRLEMIRLSYEFVINLPGRFGVVESALTLSDFTGLVGLEFEQTRKFAGLVHLLPRDVAAGQLAFHEGHQIEDAVFAVLAHLLSGDLVHAPHVHLVPGKPTTFHAQSEQDSEQPFERGGGRSPLVRRRDGVWALRSGWALFHRTRVAGPVPSVSDGSKLREMSDTDRQLLVFLARYEALWAARSGGPSSPEAGRYRGGAGKLVAQALRLH